MKKILLILLIALFSSSIFASDDKPGRFFEDQPDVIKKYGGEYLARGGEHQVVEGEDNFPRIVIIKFPTYEKALEWYHSCLLYTSPSPRD